MADRYLLESGSPDGYLLEDGSGVLLLDASRLWLPSDLTTAPKCWLDADALTGADASTVSTFTDRVLSFDATLASGTGPVLRYASQNGLKTVEFSTASAAQMTMSSSLMNGATEGAYFAVFKLKNDPTTSSANGGDVGAVLDAFTSDLSVPASHHPFTDGNFYDHFGVTSRQTLGDPAPSFSTSHRIFNCEITSGGTYTNRIDATQFFQAAGQTVGFGAKTRNLAWTNAGGGAVYYLNGYVGEVLILDAVPASGDLAKIEGYLAWKWGLQANLPGGHAYASAAPTVALTGGTTLTGQSLTNAIGSVLAATALALSGGALTGSQGSVAPQVSPALTSQSATAARGSVSPNVTVALTGQSLSAAQGTVVGGSVVTGQSTTVAQGSVTQSVSVALTGQSLTAARGTLTPNTAEAISGQSLSSAQGTLTPGIAEALTGQALVAARGSVTQSSSVGLSGQSAAVARGTVIPTFALGLSGLSLTAARDTVSVGGSSDVTAALTGQSISAAIGSVVASISAALSGQALSSAGGSLVPAYALALSGQEASATQGAVQVAPIDVTLALTGLSLSVALGDPISSFTTTYKFWRQPPLIGRRTSPGRSR